MHNWGILLCNFCRFYYAINIQAVTHQGEEGLIEASGFLAEDIAMELGGPDV